MKILITGAAGHIGSKLTEQFSKKYKLFIIDSLISGRYPSIFYSNSKKRFFFINEDILEYKDLDEVIKKVDIVIHLAAMTDATKSVGMSDLYIKHNHAITKKVCKICAKHKKKLIYVSSTSVYGTQKKIVDENCSASELKPQSPYAKSKLLEEKTILNLRAKKKLKCIILRFGTIYGYSTGMRFHTAVNKFCFQASLNKKLTVWKTAINQKRPYLNLDDGINFIIFVIKKNIFNGEIYNVVSHNLTVADVIKSIKNVKKNLKINFVKSAIMNQLSFEVSNKKVLKLGFKFKPNLQKQINKTIRQLNFLN